MKTSHTPGPWTDDGHSGTTEQIIINSQWGEVARVTMAGDYPQRDANARLIAAAPELLEALQFVSSHCDPNDKRHILPEQVASAIRTAIAKATTPDTKEVRA